VSTGGGTRAILAAFAADLGIAIAKFVAFVFTGSASMLSESIHSLADRVRAVVPIVRPSYIGPDISRGDRDPSTGARAA
jgi:divalent metal cation (Fe/Co/Zn/Cd) transporter